MKIVRMIWQERIFLALLVNIGVLLYIANLVQHKNVEVDGGMSESDMENALSKGINVNIAKIADEDLDLEYLDQNIGVSLRLKPPVIPWTPGQPIPLPSKPLPGSPIDWGYVQPAPQ